MKNTTLSSPSHLIHKSVLKSKDRVKAEMDLKELSETVQQQQQQHQQQQAPPATVATPKRPIRSLDKTIESCKAQLGIYVVYLYVH